MDTERTMALSFSAQAKEELLARLTPVESLDAEAARRELALALMAYAHIDAIDMQITTARSAYAERLQQLLGRSGAVATPTRGRELLTLRVEEGEAADAVGQLLADIVGYDPRQALEPNGDEALAPLYALDAEARRHQLAALFLACGSIADPERAYHIEFAVRVRSIARLLAHWLREEGIEAAMHSRFGLSLIYVKEGQAVSDILGLMGAHQALLRFESLRVEKEMRNVVNRMVNCDSANAQRIADSAARQLELLAAFREQAAWHSLPDELREAAELRLVSPAASLRELGELAQPPIGKSGMNHRMKRLEAWIRDSIEEGGHEGPPDGDA